MRLSAIKSTPILIGLVTGSAIIVSQILSTLLVYDFFRFDSYLAMVAVLFLSFGYLIAMPAYGKRGLGNSVDSQIEGLKVSLRNLSNRELSILQMIALGNINKEIAENLGIELSTVKTHINNIYTKINATNRKEAREKWSEWKRHGLIS